MAKQKTISTNNTLLSEWNWAKNRELGLNPDFLTLGSTKKVWWICPKKHEYAARVDNRFYGNVGCPFCAGKKPILGATDLASQRPDLIVEWDYSKNVKGPEEYTLGSNKTVNWICQQCGNRYKRVIKDRVEGHGCPKCGIMRRAAGRVVGIIKVQGSFEELHHDLALEWDFSKNKKSPDEYSEKSEFRAWWKCPVCGRSYEKKIAKRSAGEGCPYCSGHKVLVGFNDIESQFPDLALEWDFEKNGDLNPCQFTKGSDQSVWWKCENGHVWQATISSRTQGHGCPYCAGLKCVVGENDLLTLNPELAQEWFQERNGNLRPYDVSTGSNKKVWWKCSKCGREWRAAISSRNSGNGCSKCSADVRGELRHKYALEHTGSILKTHPELAQEWDYDRNDGKTPDMYSRGSDEKVWWKCLKGHSWKAAISSRVSGNNCPRCSSEIHSSFAEQAIYYYLTKCVQSENRAKVFGREIDIFIPSMAMGIEYNGKYWHRYSKERDRQKVLFCAEKGIRIISVIEGSENSVQGDIITYKYKHRDFEVLTNVIRVLFYHIGIQCPDVNLERDSTEINSLFMTYEKANSIAIKAPWLCKEWDYELNGTVTPEMVTTGSDKKMHWKCKKGHQWTATVSSRVSGNGCPICANKKLLKGFNDLSARFPEIAQEWNYEKNNGLTPEMVLAGAHKKVWWECSKGHEWFADIHARTGKQKCGCPICVGKKPRDYSLDK